MNYMPLKLLFHKRNVFSYLIWMMTKNASDFVLGKLHTTLSLSPQGVVNHYEKLSLLHLTPLHTV